MITVMEFRAKQGTGIRYMLTDKLNDNYFFIGIDFGLIEAHKRWQILGFSSHFSMSKISQILSQFLFH